MFTGLIRCMGTLCERRDQGDGQRIVIGHGGGLSGLRAGDSVAVSGVCLSALEVEPHRLAADLSTETLALTTLGQLAIGQAVNLEPSLRFGDPLDGHLVTGHVDATGRVRRIDRTPESARVWIDVPGRLAPLIAAKGSIAVDGVSLTVNEIDGAGFRVQLIPHTCRSSTLGELMIGQPVNLEVDLLARYVAGWLQAREAE